MSKCYRVRAKGVRQRIVQTQKSRKHRLELLPILSPERMRAEVSEELKNHGFERDLDHSMKRQDEEVDLIWDESSGLFEIRITHRERIRAEVDGEIEAETPDEKTATEHHLERQLSIQEQAIDQKLEQDFAALLDRLDQDLEPLLLEVQQAAHKKALIEKAGRLGEIETVEDQNGEVVIRVKV